MAVPGAQRSAAEDEESAARGAGGASAPSAKRNVSRVPSGQLERVARFTSLGVGMAFGAVGSIIGSAVTGTFSARGGLKGALLSERNSDRLTLALCRMRGAALKLGQLLSIQDEHVIPKDSPLRAVIDRVREEAEQMPAEQLHRVLQEELGEGWRALLAGFDEEPMAAASIGQVHRAQAAHGMPLALKVQYPGVADSIDSDVSTLEFLLTPLAPRGLFLGTALGELRAAMAAETDYLVEADMTERMRALLSPARGFRVPRVARELSARRVLATEFLSGVPIDQVAQMPQAVRDSVAQRIMLLTVRELFEFHLMQTDPNWSNFLYDAEADSVNLIDFGATVEYAPDFCYQYATLVRAAAHRDREALLRVCPPLARSLSLSLALSHSLSHSLKIVEMTSGIQGMNVSDGLEGTILHKTPIPWISTSLSQSSGERESFA